MAKSEKAEAEIEKDDGTVLDVAMPNDCDPKMVEDFMNFLGMGKGYGKKPLKKQKK